MMWTALAIRLFAVINRTMSVIFKGVKFGRYVQRSQAIDRTVRGGGRWGILVSTKTVFDTSQKREILRQQMSVRGPFATYCVRATFRSLSGSKRTSNGRQDQLTQSRMTPSRPQAAGS